MDVEDKLLWQQYFNTIKPVCPWSSVAYSKNRIDFRQWMGIAYPLLGYEARIYLTGPIKEKTLIEYIEYLNQSKKREEWFYSLPNTSKYSAPYHCLIQQSHSFLNKIRKKYQFEAV